MAIRPLNIYTKTLLTLCLAPWSLQALPTSPKAIHGWYSSEEHEIDHVIEVRVSDRAIIEWQDFSIDEHETVTILLPDAMSSVVCRDISENPSRISGRLICNGNLILINSSGINVTDDAEISSFSIAMSTFDIEEQDFVEKTTLNFYGDSTAIINNEGTIESQKDAMLIQNYSHHYDKIYSCMIANEDILEAHEEPDEKGGTFLMASKKASTLVDEGSAMNVSSDESETIHLIGQEQAETIKCSSCENCKRRKN